MAILHQCPTVGDASVQLTCYAIVDCAHIIDSGLNNEFHAHVYVYVLLGCLLIAAIQGSYMGSSIANLLRYYRVHIKWIPASAMNFMLMSMFALLVTL